MNQTSHFPRVLIKQGRQGIEASAGIAMKSILKGNLVRTQGDFSDDKASDMQGPDRRYFQINREAFLHALAGWPEHMTLEVRITTAPDLHCKPQGKIHIAILLHTHAETEEIAKEEIITRYLALMPLLIAHFPEIEFIPVVEDKELADISSLFQPTHALAIHRRVQRINLSEPFQRRVVGLQATQSSSKEGRFTLEHRLPWAPSLDEWSRLMNTFMNQLDPIQLIVRIKRTSLKAGQRKQLENNLRNCELYLSSGEPYQLALKKQAELIRDVTLEHFSDLSSACFHTGVFLLAPHPIDVSLGYVTGRAITGDASAKERRLFKGDFAVTEIEVKDVLDNNYFFEKQPFSVAETASAFRFPSPPLEDYSGLPVRRSRSGLAMTSLNHSKKEHAITLFTNEHKQAVQPIALGANDRMRHTFIIGQTGTGKSTLMESMILQDIKAGQGLAVIDPHGDLIDSILGKIPAERLEDVILFDVLDRERPLGFNILEWSTIDERDLIIDEIYTVIDHLYDMKLVGGPMFESNLRGTLKLLMGDQKHGDFTPTILTFITCYASSGFRNWLKSRTDDPGLLDFIRELEKTGGEASLQNIAPYITSKFGRYTNDTTLRRIIGQERTSFDFEDIMNNGKIFLVKLSNVRLRICI
ncbi:MAG: DUF87 domain-containing protein [Syntrophales bacterium]|nr:DUF87 domain-containing protein [Syntrophales bacterium]